MQIIKALEAVETLNFEEYSGAVTVSGDGGLFEIINGLYRWICASLSCFHSVIKVSYKSLSATSILPWVKIQTQIKSAFKINNMQPLRSEVPLLIEGDTRRVLVLWTNFILVQFQEDQVLENYRLVHSYKHIFINFCFRTRCALFTSSQIQRKICIRNSLFLPQPCKT